MARLIHKLTQIQLKHHNRRGYLCDGMGLYLRTSKGGSKSWVFRYQLAGVNREMGLGGFPVFSIAQARERARQAKQQLADGIDPIEQRIKSNPLRSHRKDANRTFAACSVAYIDAKKHEWRNEKHTVQWSSTLRLYAMDSIGELDVKAISTQHLLDLLKPIWLTKTETATRVRGRIERILDWATAVGLRHGENPARWKGHLQNLLAAPKKVSTIEHHPSLPYDQLPAFYQQLRMQSGLASTALQLLVLCASRTGEILGATWDEVDMANKTWTIPGRRMKGFAEHAVPLPEAAMNLLREQRQQVASECNLRGSVKDGLSRVADECSTTVLNYKTLVFTNGLKPLSNMSMAMLLRRMDLTNITVHGFRSTFRTWAAEQTTFPREVIELALAHTNTNKVEAAYLRTDYIDRRRELMEQWSQYVMGAIEFGGSKTSNNA